jgi:hypothetical protein
MCKEVVMAYFKICLGTRKTRRESEDNIKMGLKEMEWYGFIWLRIGPSGGLL